MRREMIAIFAALVCAADMTAAALPAPQWISGDSADPAKPAPMLLKEFALDAKQEPTADTIRRAAKAAGVHLYLKSGNAGFYADAGFVLVQDSLGLNRRREENEDED